MDAAPPGTWEMIGQLALALFIGAAVGFEREQAEKPAGLRTLAAVSFGACIFALLAHRLIHQWDPLTNVQLDPIRVVAGLVGGIGFLGGGAIFQSRGSVEGVTTAAAIWVTGGLGLACGIAYYELAIAGAVGALFILRGLGVLERLLFPGDGDKES